MIRFYNGPVLTLQQNQMNITHQEVWVDGNLIVCLGANPGAKADREIDLNGDLLMPAFKNAHTHSAMTFGRSFSDDLPLQSWLYDKIFPLEAKLTAEDIYHLSRLAFLEYLESGISACFDMYYFPEAMAKAAVDAGFRTVMCGAVNNFKESPALLEEYYNTYNNYHPLVSYQLGFHAEYTTNRSIMEAIAALAEKYKAPVYMHASETESEVQDCIGRYGMTPTALFEHLGLWNYGGGAFHSVWVSNEDLNIYKKHGVYAVLNAGSNAKLASGIARVPEMLAAGIRVGLGTDGNVCNNSLDLFEEMKFASLLQKAHRLDAAALPANVALRMATIEGARVLGMDREIGSIEVGKRADLLLLDLAQPNMCPIVWEGTQTNVLWNLVYSARGSNVKTVLVDGKVILENGRSTLVDETALLQGAQAQTLQLMERRKDFAHTLVPMV